MERKACIKVCMCMRTVYWIGVYVLYVAGSLAKSALKYQIMNSFAGLSLVSYFSNWEQDVTTTICFWIKKWGCKIFGWLCMTRWQALECNAERGQSQWQRVWTGQCHATASTPAVSAVEDLRHSCPTIQCRYHTEFGDQGDTLQSELTV